MKKTILLLLSFTSFTFAFAQDVPELFEEEPYGVIDVFSYVDEMPLFSKACDFDDEDKSRECTLKEIQKYLAKVAYPQFAIDNEVQGKVYVSFVVAVDGSIIDIQLLRGVDKLLDDAAMQHLKNMPSFYAPGIQRGKPVKVRYSIPINFKLDLDEPLSRKERKRLRKEVRNK